MPMQPAEASQTDPHEPAGKAPTRRRLSNGLLALGSAAVAAVYAVGYASTQSSVDDLTAALDVPTAPVGGAVPTVGPSTVGGGAAAGPSLASPLDHALALVARLVRAAPDPAAPGLA